MKPKKKVQEKCIVIRKKKSKEKKTKNVQDANASFSVKANIIYVISHQGKNQVKWSPSFRPRMS